LVGQTLLFYRIQNLFVADLQEKYGILALKEATLRSRVRAPARANILCLFYILVFNLTARRTKK
jgi:hypothetical protein